MNRLLIVLEKKIQFYSVYGQSSIGSSIETNKKLNPHS